ncbi:MAG: S16 family serine protease [Acidimicrobiales bacterium]
MPTDDEHVAVDDNEQVAQREVSSDANEAPKRLRRGLRVAISIVVVLGAAVFIASRWSVPYYAITPGHAFNIGTLISVPGARSHSHKGSVILTDVDLTPLSALGYVYYELHDSSAIIGSAALTGGQNNSAYTEEGVIDMANARQAATLVALRTLGYDTRAIANGTAVYATEPGTKNTQAPDVGSVIVAADGQSALTATQLTRAISARTAGSVFSLTFHALGKEKTTTRTYRLGDLARSTKATGSVLECVPSGGHVARPVTKQGKVRGCLPFDVVQTYRNAALPFVVKLSSGGIVGPSAGLSFTLGLIEKLDRKDLTGGARVAATGTMSNDGSVGAVGGVAEKTRAVRAAGAEVFLVPPSGLQAARANAGPHLKIIDVSSIGQAVSALEGLGGRLEPSAGRV